MLHRSCICALLLTLSVTPGSRAQKSQGSNIFLAATGIPCEAPLPLLRDGGVPKASSAPPMVRIAYVIPSNRTAQPHGVAAIQEVILLGQDWFRRQTAQNGFEARTFRVETEEDGMTALVHVVSVPETDDDLRGDGGLDLWDRTIAAAGQAGLSIWEPGEVWVLVPEAHVMAPDGSISGGVALGAGFGSNDDPGVTMLGSDALAMLEPGNLSDDRSPDGLVFPALGPHPYQQDVTFPDFMGNSVSSVASSFTGALLHELGHALGFPHDFRNDNNFHGNLMFNGLRGIRGNVFPDRYPDDYARLTYAEALFVTTSAYFNDDRIRNDPPALDATLPDGGVPRDGQLHISFTASDPDGLAHATLLLGGDRVGEMALSGFDTTAVFATPYHHRGGASEYDVTVYDIHGNRQGVRLTVDADLSANWAPQPFVRMSPAIPRSGKEVLFDSGQSSDPDDDPATLTAEWDFDGDGEFETPLPAGDSVARVLADGNHLIRLRVTDPSGAQTISTPVSIHVRGESDIAREDEIGVPSLFALHQNYPNPFNPATEIVFDVMRPARVRLVVFDLLGREVAVLLDDTVAPGRHAVTFRAAGVPAGVYVYRLESGGSVEARRLVLAK